MKMTCREITDFLAEYIAGKTSAEEKAIFDEHMRDCPPCHVYMEQYKRTIELGKRACKDDDPAASEIPEGVIKAILAARPGRPGNAE